MTTQTIYQTTCNVCEYVTTKISNGFNFLIEHFEVAGRAKAAGELARMGYLEESKSLMLELTAIRKELEESKKK